MNISFAAPSVPSSGALVVGVLEGKKLTPSATNLNKLTDGALKRALANGTFTGKKGELLEIVAPAKLENSRILLVGLGEPGKLTERTCRRSADRWRPSCCGAATRKPRSSSTRWAAA
jgi:leucyl aminopeptidase